MRSTAGKKLPLELLLLVQLLVLAGVLALVFGLHRDPGAWAVVRIDGREAARYPLNEQGRYPLNGGTNLLVIENGEAWIARADCPDKVCVNQGKVKYAGQCITCLPNRLTVTLEGAPQDVELVS